MFLIKRGDNVGRLFLDNIIIYLEVIMTELNFPKLLNQKEVAKIIRKSEAWLERQRWLNEGIPYRKVGRNVFYEEKDIALFLENQPKVSISYRKADHIDFQTGVR